MRVRWLKGSIAATVAAKDGVLLRRFSIEGTGFVGLAATNPTTFSSRVTSETDSMDRNEYRCEAATVAGFLAQIVRYVSSGHYFYIRLLIPKHKDPQAVDEKLIRLYDIARPRWRRERRRLKRSAGIHYLRHDHLAVIMLTKGRHDDFYRDHGNSVADIRRQALKAFGYSIRYSLSAADRRMKVFVRLDDARYRKLKNHLLTLATWESFRPAERLEHEFRRLPVQVYGPVFEQLMAILKQVNRARRGRGFSPASPGCLPCKVRPTKVFADCVSGSAVRPEIRCESNPRSLEANLRSKV